MNKHTPGPWRNDNGVEISAGKCTSICGMRHPFDDAEKMANANLIAAAPDLLAALELMVRADQAIEREEGLCSDRILLRIAALDAAAEALAKAKGEA